MDYAGTVLHLVSVARSCFLLNGGDSHSTNLIVVLTMNSSLPVRLVRLGKLGCPLVYI